MIMPPSDGPHIRDPPQDRDGWQRGGISRDAAFPRREFHPPHRGWTELRSAADYVSHPSIGC
jgi:hypothetical protein